MDLFTPKDTDMEVEFTTSLVYGKWPSMNPGGPIFIYFLLPSSTWNPPNHGRITMVG